MWTYFQVSSIITTTGYAIVDFDQWPAFRRIILFLLIFIGGCAGSTSGGSSLRYFILELLSLYEEVIGSDHCPGVLKMKNNLSF
ncbi:MAG TPA: hypothetical protein GXX70_00685 [Tepidimicrobium sp.]|nr:hypothetical protein [Tepidimicrobium sp.]